MTALSRRELLRKSLVSGAGLFVAFHVPRKVRAVPEPAASRRRTPTPSSGWRPTTR